MVVGISQRGSGLPCSLLQWVFTSAEGGGNDWSYAPVRGYNHIHCVFVAFLRYFRC